MNELNLTAGTELVLFAPITDTEEIRYVLKTICKRFGYKVKLIPSGFDPMENPGIEIDITKLCVNKDVKVFSIGRTFILDSLAELDSALDKRLITLKFYENHKNDSQKLKDLVYSLTNIKIPANQVIKLVLIDQNNIYTEIKHILCPGKDETSGLSFVASENTAVLEFPILGNIYLLAPDKFKYITFEEGGAGLFEEWLNVLKNQSPEMQIKWLKKHSYDNLFAANFSFKSQE